PQLLQVKFSDFQQAQKFRKFLPRAGSLIGFQPSQLSLQDQDGASKTVTIQRRIPVNFSRQELSSYFQYATVKDNKGNPTEFYRGLINDRMIFLGSVLGGPSENSSLIQTALNNLQDPASQNLLVQVCQNMLNISKVFEKNPSIRHRYFASFSQNENATGRSFIEAWISAVDGLKDQTKLQRIALSQDITQNSSLAIIQEQKKEFLLQRETLLSEAATIIRKYIGEFSAGKTPLNFTTMGTSVKSTPMASVQTFSLQGCNFLVESITVDWNKGEATLNLYPDIQSLRQETSGLDHEKVDQVIYNEIATLSRQSSEKVTPLLDHFVIAMNVLPEAQSFLALKLYNIAKAESATLKDAII
ncbi:MAG: hypothetical protein ACRDFB_04050, partial [Rhabdochlamydiaceae bacterium]